MTGPMLATVAICAKPIIGIFCTSPDLVFALLLTASSLTTSRNEVTCHKSFCRTPR